MHNCQYVFDERTEATKSGQEDCEQCVNCILFPRLLSPLIDQAATILKEGNGSNELIMELGTMQSTIEPVQDFFSEYMAHRVVLFHNSKQLLI